ncbi:MAG: NADH-quinone oxidoreductase subunit J [candidate division Zixibacteria bacterium]|jgi:NADH-quinone oxidoreductase subunit J|nr:NADH-quinone oxidoreductase subunit J [candidate division Zixibacteria bacterium]
MTPDYAIFLISAAVAVFGATMMIMQRNPVASVLYLIVSLVAQAVVYVQLGAIFIGAILIIVYAGAILVLFLFVIMLLNLRADPELSAGMPPLSWFTKTAVPVLLIVELYFVIDRVLLPEAPTGIVGEVAGDFGSVHSIATKMFTDYLFPVQLTGVLLLVAVVGAVVIARRESAEPRKDVGATDNRSEQRSGSIAG